MTIFLYLQGIFIAAKMSKSMEFIICYHSSAGLPVSTLVTSLLLQFIVKHTVLPSIFIFQLKDWCRSHLFKLIFIKNAVIIVDGL